MIKFNITEDFYIRKLDHKNWVIAKTRVANQSGKTKEYIKSYHSTLIGAYHSASNSMPLEAKDLIELHKVLEKMEKLRITIIKHENKPSDTSSL